jgi:hypothetical protein
MKSKRKHKHKEERYYLSGRRAFNDLVRYNRKICELIKVYDEQVRTLANHPF